MGKCVPHLRMHSFWAYKNKIALYKVKHLRKMYSRDFKRASSPTKEEMGSLLG
jgi:hypothetical protein